MRATRDIDRSSGRGSSAPLVHGAVLLGVAAGLLVPALLWLRAQVIRQAELRRLQAWRQEHAAWCMELDAAFARMERRAVLLAASVEEAIAAAPPADDAAWQAAMERHADGIWRTRRQGFAPELHAGVWVPPYAAQDARRRGEHLATARTIAVFGRGACGGITADAYLLTADGANVLYWPDNGAYVFETGPEMDYRRSDWIRVAEPAANPGGHARWTPPIYDPVPHAWWVGVAAPFRRDGAYAGVVGHDVVAQRLFRAMEERRSLAAGHVAILARARCIFSNRWGSLLDGSGGQLDLGRAPGDDGERLRVAASALAGGGAAWSRDDDAAAIEARRTAGPGWTVIAIGDRAAAARQATADLAWTAWVVGGVAGAVLLASVGLAAREARRHARDTRRLRESESRSRTLIEHAPEAILLIDGASGRLVDANPQAGTLFARPPATLAGTHLAALCPASQPGGGASADEARVLLARALAGDVAMREWSFLRGDRELPCEVRLVRLPGDGGLVRASVIDVGERLEHRSAMRAIFDACPDAIAILRRAGGAVVDVSPSFERLAGIARDEAIGRDPSALGLLPQGAGPRWQAILAAGTADDLVEELRTRALGPRMVRCSARPATVRGEACVIVFLRDVTDALRADEGRRQRDKLAALGQLAGSVAHDFNNILAGIVGHADLLALRASDPRQRNAVEGISAAADRARGLVERLLRFARQGAQQPEVHDAHAAVRTALDLLGPGALRGVRAELDLAAPRSQVRGFPVQLQSAVLNLCLNARDAMPEGGPLRIATSLRVLDEASCAAMRPLQPLPGECLVIEVADGGRGMSDEVRARCFEPFFTTKGEHGTGLGLASVLAAVADHRGGIEVESAPGAGTVFRLLLPLRGEASGAQAIAPAQPNLGVVLVVDDDALVRHLHVAILAEFGIAAVGVEDGEDAIAWCRAHPGAAALALLDMGMARMGGAETFRGLRALDPGLPVAILSGTVERDTVDALLREGLSAFLAKPVAMQDLVALVRRLMRPAS